MRIARFRTSLTIRVTAAWLSGLLLGGTGALARAGAPPRVDAGSTSKSAVTPARPMAATEPPAPTKEAERVWTVPVMPKRVSWITPSTDDPWTLFDGSPALPTQHENRGEWSLAVTLDAPTALSALTVHGPA